MANPSLTLDQETLKHRLAEMPASARPHIRMGYHLLSRLPQKQLEDLRDYVLTSMQTSREIDSVKGEQLSGLNEHTIHDALTALMFTIASVVDLDVSTDDFLRSLPNEILSQEDAAVAQFILSGLDTKKNELKSAFDKSAIANAILPSFKNISFESELRVRFDRENNLSHVVPIGIFYLSTDCDDDIYFQADIDDVERLLKKLQDIKVKLEILSSVKVER